MSNKDWDVIGDPDPQHRATSLKMDPGGLIQLPPGWTPIQIIPGKSTPALKGNPKDAVGATKPQLHLVPPSALIHMAKVFELGAKKYGPYNWRDNAINMTVYISAAMRHLVSMLDGQTIDPESGEPHAAHVADCMAIIMDAGDTGNLIDDRPKPGPAADLIASLTVKKAV